MILNLITSKAWIKYKVLEVLLCHHEWNVWKQYHLQYSYILIKVSFLIIILVKKKKKQLVERATFVIIIYCEKFVNKRLSFIYYNFFHMQLKKGQIQVQKINKHLNQTYAVLEFLTLIFRCHLKCAWSNPNWTFT